MFSFLRKRRRAHPGANILAHITQRRIALAIDRLSRFPFFSAGDYRELHKDIGLVNPAAHFIRYGAYENRKAAQLLHIARVFGNLETSTSSYSTAHCSAAALTIGVYVSSYSNVVIKEIASALVVLMRNSGHSVLAGNEDSIIEKRPPYSIYVAPHEFFFLGSGPRWVRDDVLEEACMYCTEQAQTMGFWQSLPLVLMARSVVDMSVLQAKAFSEVMPSVCVLPSIGSGRLSDLNKTLNHPLLRGQAWWANRQDRPLDMYFLGNISHHRALFFTKHAERLSSYESFIYLRTKNAKIAVNSDAYDKDLVHVDQYVARHSRLLLNVHKDEFPYFEWHRIVHQGMANGCAVVSEPCSTNPEFIPGIHFLSEESHRLVSLAEWALNDADGRDMAVTVARAAQVAIRDPEKEITKARTIINLLAAGNDEKR